MTDWEQKDPTACVNRDRHFAYTVITDDLRFCGCGWRDELVTEVVNVLRGYLFGRAQNPSDGFGEFGAELLLHVMNAAELIDHGTWIRRASVTKKGLWFLTVMDGKPDDWLDNYGYACSECPEIIKGELT